ncbi:MFS general substrate transporter [Lepidopterella palustris CBS 459.81]|uniref:MFS general substrate transporter n=1 Tax=Lepidopterella palustris CBS 459.81 TaxID=1314670 RepID=A0A8E2EAW6_9PEZI|nr:MFS general substrate transporter [Lepidopterella palustris CBS 459.81]
MASKGHPNLPYLYGLESYEFNDLRISSTSSNVESLKKQLPPPTQPGWRFYAAFGCLCVVNLVCALDATSLAVALPIVAAGLHGTAIEAFWAGTSFLLAATVFQPSFASLSHVFGRKPMLLLALTLFTVGAIIAALAKNFTFLLVGRSIQGVGGGGISALTYVIVTDMVSLKERGKWFGLVTMMWAFGSVVGPVIGGMLAEKISWRWIFWLNIPFCGFAFLTIPPFLRLKPKEGRILEKIKTVDWLGSFLFIGSLTSLLIPITWGGIMYSWTSWRTTIPIEAGLIGFILFILWSKLSRVEPILRGSMFKDPSALVSYFGTVVHGMFLWSVLYYMPLYFEAVKGYSPVKSGIALFPWTFTTGPVAAAVGIMIAKTGRYIWGIYSGWFLTVLGIGLLVLLDAKTSTTMWAPIATISGLGLGILYSAMSFAIQAPASNKDLPFAAALYSFFRNFGQMLGVAVGGTVFQNQIKSNLLKVPELARSALEFSMDASALVEAIKMMPEGQDDVVLEELVKAYVDALRVLWVVMCALAGVAFLLSLVFARATGLDRELETEQGFVHDGKVGDEEK